MSNKKFIYLAGPIAGCTQEEANEWRDYVRSMLSITTITIAIIISIIIEDARGESPPPP